MIPALDTAPPAFHGSPFRADALTEPVVLQHLEQLVLPLGALEDTETALRLGGEHGLAEEGLELILVGALEGGVHRRVHLHAPTLVFDPRSEIIRNGPTDLVGHVARLLVARPAVDAAASRVDPQEVLEAKINAQRSVEHAHRERHDRPAAVARLEPLHVNLEEVVISQVNVDDELALLGVEELVLLVVGRRRRVHGPNVNLMREHLEQLLLELVAALKGEPADVDIVAWGGRVWSG